MPGKPSAGFPAAQAYSMERILGRMPAKRTPPVVPLSKLKPLLKPVVGPVLDRLERQEKLLIDIRAAMDVQFKRTAEIQAQLDILAARFDRRRK